MILFGLAYLGGVRQKAATHGRLFQIQFNDAGAEAFTFTFG